MKKMTHLPLFAGINGFGIAADWMGWEQVANCEIDEFCQTVIQYYWPKSKSHYDIKKTDFRKYKGTVDIISGGFPCQPYSTAGKRKSKEDDRHLWPEMLRAIREVEPRWVVGENVRGLVNWSGGLVFDEMQTDLEAEGYEVWAFMVPACGVNAPHRRYRIWFVAYSNKCTKGSPRTSRKTKINRGKNNDVAIRRRSTAKQHIRRGKFLRITPNTNSRRQPGKKYRETKPRQHSEKGLFEWFKDFPTQSPICTRNDGISSRLDGITFSKWRNESIKAAGNAIVPQVAYEIFKTIEAYEH